MKWSKYVLKNKSGVLGIALGLIGSSISSILLPVLLSELIVKSWSNTSKEIIIESSIILLLVIVHFMCSYLFGHCNYLLSNKALIESENDVLQDVFKLKYELISKQNSNVLAQIINNDLVCIMDFYVEKIPTICFQLITGIVTVGVMFCLNVHIGIVSVVSLILYLSVYFLSRKRVFKVNKKAADDQASFFSYIFGKLSDVLEIKIQAWNHEIKKEFKQVGEQFVKSSVVMLDLDNILKSLSSEIGRLVLLAIVLVSFCLGKNRTGTEVVTTLVSSVFYLRLLFDSASYLLNTTEMLQTYKVSLERLNKVYALETEPCGTETIDNVNEIKGESVSFGYDKNNLLLCNFSFHFQKGNAYLINGENGKGKTTFLYLLLGVLAKDSGEIYYNDKKLYDLNMELLRRDKIGYVGQTPRVLNGTIIQNLYYGLNVPQDDDLMKKYPLIDFVNQLADKENTVINSSSSNLSGGQKQRIAIVRALIKNPDILIFDEPTSALDNEGVTQFINMINQEKENRIIMIVTHDERVKASCDNQIIIA